MPKKKKRMPKTFRTWRKVNGIKLDEFARTANLKHSTVGKYDEDPNRRPQDANRDKIKAIKEYADCPLLFPA